MMHSQNATLVFLSDINVCLVFTACPSLEMQNAKFTFFKVQKTNKQTNKRCNQQQREVKDRGETKVAAVRQKQAPSHSAFQFEGDFLAVSFLIRSSVTHTHKKSVILISQ